MSACAKTSTPLVNCIVNDGLVNDGLVSDGLVNDGLVNDGLVNDGLVSDGLVNAMPNMQKTLLQFTVLVLFRQELSYRQQIARQLRTLYDEGIYRHKYHSDLEI